MKILITIIDRKMCTRVLKMFEEQNVNFNTIVHGKVPQIPNCCSISGLQRRKERYLQHCSQTRNAGTFGKIYELLNSRAAVRASLLPYRLKHRQKTLSLLKGEKMEE